MYIDHDDLCMFILNLIDCIRTAVLVLVLFVLAIIADEDSVESARLQVISSQTVASLVLNTHVVSGKLHSGLFGVLLC